MKFFKKQGKKKKQKQQSTEEQKLRRAELKRKRYLEEALVELAEKDPAFKRQLIAHTFGFTLPDPAEGPMLELEAAIDNAAIQYIKNDKDVAKDIAKAKIFKTMQSGGLAPSDEELRNRPSPMSQLINVAEEVNRLKAVMGIKEPGFFEKLFNPEVVAALLPVISTIIGAKFSPNSKEMMVSMEINGELKQIPVSEYEQLLNKGLLKKAGENEPPGDEIQKKDEDTTENNPDNTDGDRGLPIS